MDLKIWQNLLNFLSWALLKWYFLIPPFFNFHSISVLILHNFRKYVYHIEALSKLQTKKINYCCMDLKTWQNWLNFVLWALLKWYFLMPPLYIFHNISVQILHNLQKKNIWTTANTGNKKCHMDLKIWQNKLKFILWALIKRYFQMPPLFNFHNISVSILHNLQT